MRYTMLGLNLKARGAPDRCSLDADGGPVCLGTRIRGVIGRVPARFVKRRQQVRTYPVFLLVVGFSLSACDDPGGPGNPSTGTLVVSTTTAGDDPDQDGYVLTVDEVDSLGLGPTGTAEVELSAGQHTLRLLGMAEHCLVAPETPLEVSVPSGSTITVAFAVSCPAPQPPLEPPPTSRVLAFESGGDIYVARMDGSNLRRLTSDGSPNAYNREAAWSPDGSRIAFSKSDGQQGAAIYLIDADGANPTRLSPEGAYDAAPTWSPDGRRIAFESRRDSTGYGGVNYWLDPEIYVMNADGTNQVRLANHLGHNDYTPAWAPDGNRIAYVSDTAGYSHIYVINTDGTNPVQLTFDEQDDTGPEWSPDGSRIVFSRSGELFVVDADGTDLALVTRAGTASGRSYDPAWSSDGLMIATTRYTNCHVDPYGDQSCHVGIWVLRVAGGPMDLHELPLRTGFARGPSWRP